MDVGAKEENRNLTVSDPSNFEAIFFLAFLCKNDDIKIKSIKFDIVLSLTLNVVKPVFAMIYSNSNQNRCFIDEIFDEILIK